MENGNEFINYTDIFNDVVKTHLEMYPNWMDFLEDFEGENQQEETDAKIRAKELYHIITDLKNFSKQHEGICLENSSLDPDNNNCTVTFFIDNSTNTENGFDADFYLWIFQIDLSDGIITKYSNDY